MRWMKVHDGRRLLVAFLLLWMGLTVYGSGNSYAHAGLELAEPAQNSRLEDAPSQIRLVFNERLEGSLYNIVLLDGSGKKLDAGQAKLSSDRKQLSIVLPQMKEDVYTVSYHVVSADGHPVEGSYLLTIGNPPDPALQSAEQQDKLHDVHGGAHTGAGAQGLVWPLPLNDLMMWVSRVFFYMMMLLIAGWIFWHARVGQQSDGLSVWMKKHGLLLQRLHLLSWLLIGLFQWRELKGSQAVAAGQWIDFLFSSKVGLFWLLTGCLIVSGFGLLFRRRWLDLIWIAALIGVKCLYGHAAAFDPLALSIGLNAVHLAAAALWAGGILLLFLLWLQRWDDAIRVWPLFSRTALYSLLVLTASGAATTLLWLPSLHYLLYTQWGIILIVKTALILLVFAVGALLRLFWKRKKLQTAGRLLRLDLGLMGCIVLLVGVFTYITPLPANVPLYWHKMGTTIHMTAQITPNAPGTNTFIVKIWLPEGEGAPKQTVLRIKPVNKEQVGMIEIPLVPFEDQDVDAFLGFTKYAYTAEGSYLAFAGDWQLEVRATDREDNETVYKKQIRIY